MTHYRPFLLDANIFIEAHRRYYAFDIAPLFWMALIDNAKIGRVLSIDRVEVELTRGRDVLADWARGSFHEFFAPTDDEAVIEAYREIMIWSQCQAQFTESAKNEFVRAADGWLVAYAMAKECIVVTHEQLSSEKKTKIKIPNACNAFGIECVDTFQMMRSLGMKLG